MLTNPVSTQSPGRISLKGKGDRGDAKSSSPESPPMSRLGPGGDRGTPGDVDEAERDAIQNEERYATRQIIPQAEMVAGLIKAARFLPVLSCVR